MALTLCRKKNSIGCQDHCFLSTNCQPTCHFSTNCQSNLCLQYASGSRTTSFKKYKKTLCREVFFAPFFSTMCHFFSSMRCPGFFRFFKKKLLFCQWWSRTHCRVFSSYVLSSPFMLFMFISCSSHFFYVHIISFCFHLMSFQVLSRSSDFFHVHLISFHFLSCSSHFFSF